MTQFFPFPIDKYGSIQPNNAKNNSSSRSKSRGKGKAKSQCSGLQENKNLAHLLTATCSLPKSFKFQDYNTSVIELHPRYFFYAKLTFYNQQTLKSRVMERVGFKDGTRDELEEECKEPGEKLEKILYGVEMQFFDAAHDEQVPIGRKGEIWNFGTDWSWYDSELYFERRNQCFNVNYAEYEDGSSIEHLKAFLWIDSSVSKDPYRLSFYWDTTQPFHNPERNVPENSKRDVLNGIFRFNFTLTRAIQLQHELITCLDHDLLVLRHSLYDYWSDRDLPDVAEDLQPKFLHDVSEEALHPTPAGFNLKLRDYQAQTLSWLIKQEANPYFFNESAITSIDGKKQIDLEKGRLFEDPFPQKARGGIIADLTGSGKTVLSLALMKESPMVRSQIPNDDLNEYDGGKLIVKATLVLCPANLVNQWESEFFKCMETGGKVLKVTTVNEAKRLTMKDVTEADMIVMSHAFLSNKNFYERHGSYKVKLLSLKYHRMIIDEFHEFLQIIYTSGGELRRTPVVETFRKLKSYRVLGLTGTPNYQNINNVVGAAFILGVHMPATRIYTTLFKQHYVRRNVPDLKLPPIVYNQIDVHLQPAERAIYQSLGTNTMDALMLCNHFDMQNVDLNDHGSSNNEAVNGINMISVEDVAKRIQNSRQLEIKKVSVKLSSLQSLLDTALQADDAANNSGEIERLDREVENMSQQLAKLNGEFMFFDNVLKTLDKRSEQECNICMEEFGSDAPVALTRCGHMFCVPCMDKSLEMKNVCPMCRQPVNNSSIYKVSAPPVVEDQEDEDEEEQEEDEMIDHRFYGSKVKAMADYIRKLLKDREEARVILFVQFTRLTKLVSDAFSELGVENSFVFGNIFQRNNAIDQFRQNKVRVIMLSAETSVTGLQLTEATHVILLHPFYHEHDNDKAIANEKQGVARAYRIGLKHELKVIRFVVKDSVEEHLLRNRPALPV